jgi:cytosine/adenosine deaminase-related metal-dependent hydrolase
MATRTLLKNGVVVVHGPRDDAKGVKSDVLIEGDRIAQIAADITPSAGVEVIDCTDKIIAPGFIDTHRHMYNTALRGMHANDLLPDYLVKGKLCCVCIDGSSLA